MTNEPVLNRLLDRSFGNLLLPTYFFILILLLGCDTHETTEVHFLTKHWEKPIPFQAPPEDLTSLSAKECGQCHEEIYNDWKESFHAQAWHDPQFQAEWAKDDPLRVCLNCHIPGKSAGIYDSA